jgi:hypothetical protein
MQLISNCRSCAANRYWTARAMDVSLLALLALLALSCSADCVSEYVYMQALDICTTVYVYVCMSRIVIIDCSCSSVFKVVVLIHMVVVMTGIGRSE